MSKLRNKVWQAALFVSLALIFTGTSEVNARGGGGHGSGGHVGGGSAVVRSVSGPSASGNRGGGFNAMSGFFNNPKPSPKPRVGHAVRNYGGGRGGYYNNNYNNNLANQPNYYQQSGPVNGQVFSGAAHIDPSQYGHYVQSYQWPGSKP